MKTFADIQQMKQRGQPIAALTAYDYPIGRLLDEAGVDVILVGDSLGMVVLGLPDTTGVTMHDMVHHTRAVASGVKNALIVGDLPAQSYVTPKMAVQNSKWLIEAGATAVKLEGGVAMKAQIEAIVAEGIPIMGHIGMLPQSVKEEGGYRLKGKTEESAQLVKQDALAVQAAGAFAVVLELVVPPVTKEITQLLKIPTIGIGSGKDSDGQILVSYDLFGLFPWFTPKFVQPKIQMGTEIKRVVEEYCREVKASE